MATFSSGDMLAGRYRLNRSIARGGMGEVWAAWDCQLEVSVAVKVMSPATLGSSELLLRFEREAKAAAQIRSPHAAHIFGHGVECGLPFIVMELLEGEDLSARLKKRPRLSLSETWEIVRGACKALRKAHDIGIVHRDLKPANIFHARQDEDEVIKVLDFGIAMITLPEADGRVTATGAILGTAHYMAPEQAQFGARRVDLRADLWSLGVIAFRALTGHLPFEGHAIEVITKVFRQDAPKPSSIAPDLTPDVDQFFARALARTPDRRFSSAPEMAAAFSGLLSASGSRASLGESWLGEPPEKGGNATSLRDLKKTVRIVTSPAPGKSTLPMVPLPQARAVFSRGTSLRGHEGAPALNAALPSAPPGIANVGGNEETIDAAEVIESSEEDDSDLAVTVFRGSVSVGRGTPSQPISSLPAPPPRAPLPSYSEAMPMPPPRAPMPSYSEAMPMPRAPMPPPRAPMPSYSEAMPMPRAPMPPSRAPMPSYSDIHSFSLPRSRLPSFVDTYPLPGTLAFASPESPETQGARSSPVPLEMPSPMPLPCHANVIENVGAELMPGEHPRRAVAGWLLLAISISLLILAGALGIAGERGRPPHFHDAYGRG